MKNSYRKTLMALVKVTIFGLFIGLSACASHPAPDQGAATSGNANTDTKVQPVLPGIWQTKLYFPLLPGKHIAVVANQTSMRGNIHLVDLLLENHFQVMKVFAPEHGFRGDHDAGQRVENARDPKTGLPVISLYGKHKKPLPADLQNIDIIIFDIQDVGARFYTYLSTLHYVMEAAAENHIPVIVLDRPNPHIDEIDGPVMQPQYFSFVGMHPVPILYGMTIGEYARMINGEGWLRGGVHADLTVVPVLHYDRHTPYTLPVKPSPNLPNAQAVMLYPSLCLLEPTDVSVGRGTDWPFQVFGAPDMCPADFKFVPQPNAGAHHPKHRGEQCCGKDLRHITPPKGLHIEWLIWAYNHHRHKDKFFKKYFERIAGTAKLRQQIQNGVPADSIRASWQDGLTKFRQIRKKYLLYPEHLH